MGLVHLPTWMVDFYGFHVGKYTSPMDPSWVKAFETFLNLWEVCRFPTFLGRSMAKKATDIHQFGGFPNPRCSLVGLMVWVVLWFIWGLFTFKVGSFGGYWPTCCIYLGGVFTYQTGQLEGGFRFSCTQVQHGCFHTTLLTQPVKINLLWCKYTLR